MLFLTGDCHGDFHRFSTKAFPIQKKLTKQDIVVILGDGGLLWDGGKQDNWWMDWLDAKPFTTVNIGGNHEAYDLLEQYPHIRWHGGKAYQLRPSVLHLCRGQVFDLNGRSTFVLGGAQSHDMQVILPPGPDLSRRRRRMERLEIPYRVYGQSWWPQELPSPAELFTAWNTLQQERWSVDLILTHCAPSTLQRRFAPEYPTNALTDFLQLILSRTSYDHWFCGHYHRSEAVPEQDFRILNEEIILLDE